MNAYATAATCRHAMLVEHFGQQWSRGPCGACDVCLGKVGLMEDARTIGQKILSCVLRVRERFGTDYVSQVLVGSKEARILSAGHDQLSTWGLLKNFRRQDVRQWVEQLVSQKFLRKEGEFNTILVTEDGRRLLRGECEPMLSKPVTPARGGAAEQSSDSWEGVDRQLFDILRQLRREIAAERGVPSVYRVRRRSASRNGPRPPLYNRRLVTGPRRRSTKAGRLRRGVHRLHRFVLPRELCRNGCRDH